MNNNNLMIFDSPDFGTVRIVESNGEPWFVSADICKALELAPTAVRRLEEDEKAGLRLTQTSSNGTEQGRLFTVVNEPGLYTLILGSRKPEAKAFKRWITHEVIPSIRKHGAYVTDSVLNQLDEKPELITDYIEQLRAENAEAKKNREKLEQIRAENGRLTEKAGYFDQFVSTEDVTCLRYTAKELGIPQKKFIGYLIENNYVFRDSGRNGRVFVRASERNNPRFATKDFYLLNGQKSEYTLVTPVGKAYFRNRIEKILAWTPGTAAAGHIADEPVTELRLFS